MRSFTTVAVLLALACASGLVLRGVNAQEKKEDDKPKYTIKQVMEKAHKNKLLNKVAAGEGTKEDAQQLLELYQALGKNQPPKGEAEGWKKKTVAIAEAAKEVVDGKPGAGAKLTKAANCANCHKEHKPA
jgi:hypothetical protein